MAKKKTVVKKKTVSKKKRIPPNPFPKGNTLWKKRAVSGQPKKFATPQILWSSCVEYFKWTEENPLYEDKPFHYKGKIVHAAVPKMRAMTISGLCLFLGISGRTWVNYRENKDYKDVVEAIETVIYNQKFSGAAADLLNANIIAREIGLTEKTEQVGEFKVVIGKDDAKLL